jgi:hypothetical protein
MTYVDELARQIQHEIPSELLPSAHADALFRLYALLGLVKGATVSAEDVHDAWVVWMADRGIDHRSMVPFDELPQSVRHQDEPFAAAIRNAVSSSLRREPPL